VKFLHGNEIKDLEYRILRANIELNNLKKMLEKKKRMGSLSEEREYELEKEISKKQAEIRGFESRIIGIENEKKRAENFSRRF